MMAAGADVGRVCRRAIEVTCLLIQRRQWHPLQYSCLENPMDGGAW